MHFKNKKAKGNPQLRKNSSDWRYPKLEKGHVNQGRASMRRWIERAMNSFKEWNATR